jgi:hypothetical protein
MLYSNISDSVYSLYVWYRPLTPRLQQPLSKTRNTPPLYRLSSIFSRYTTLPTLCPPLLSPILQRLRKLTPLPNRRPLPIEDINRKRNDQRKTARIVDGHSSLYLVPTFS